jgi:parvulin-like peptidyl-prolyl isomerase
MEKHMRTLRTVGVAEALDLETADALKVDAQMRSFDERRRPLQKLVHDSMHTLKRAAEGDAQALAQVDSATQKILDTRTQLAQLDREMYVNLAQGRSAQQKARLALFLAHFREEARSMKGMGWHGSGGKPGQDEP